MSGTTIFVAISLAAVAFFLCFLVALCRESRAPKCQIVHLTGQAPRSGTAAVLQMPLHPASIVRRDAPTPQHLAGRRA